MPRYIPVDPERHKAAGFQKSKGWEHSAKDWVAPVLIEELPKVIPLLPLAFVLLEDAFQLVVVQSLHKGENVVLGVNEGRWLTPYVPAIYRGYPFAMLPAAENSEPALCIDEESPVYRPVAGPGDASLFDETGKPGQIVEKVSQFWKLYETQRRATRKAVDALEKQNVIASWDIRIQSGEGEAPLSVEGLYKVDEEMLNALSLAALENLRRAGALPVAYAQIFSQHRLDVLAKLHRARSTALEAPETEIDIDKLFGADDKFRF